MLLGRLSRPPPMSAVRRMLAPGEGRPVLRSAAALYLLWLGYGMLRPLRDEVGATHSDELDLLWTGTFFAALLAVPFYGYLAARSTPRRTVSFTYRFIALVLVGFWALFRSLDPEGIDRVWTDRAFYVFVSVYNLFVLSLIWSLASEAFRSEQGKRVFGLVAAGISLGAVSGNAVTAFLVERTGTAPLVLAAAVSLEFALRLARGVVPEQRTAQHEAAHEARDPWWRGLQALFTDRYLRTVTIYLLLFLVGSGFLYVLKSGMVRAEFPDRGARGAFLARLDLITNSATLLLQVFLTGRILPRFGVGLTLAVVPLVTLLGFGALAAAPALMVVAGVEVSRRVSEFAMSKPAREVLFTVAGRRARFQSKPLMDTLIYRGGDVLVVQGYEGLAAIGFGPAALAAVVLPFAAAGLGLALLLGKMHGARQNDS